MHQLIAGKREEITNLCRRFHVRSLEVFGSAARGEDFDPARSDVDFLVEFQPAAQAAYADTYFGLLEELEALLQRRVDLIRPSAIRNPFFKASVEETRESVYEA